MELQDVFFSPELAVTNKAGYRHIALLDRIRDLGIPLNGSLAFVNDWSYITDNPDLDFEQLTSSGPYAGTLEAFTTGVRLQTRYSHLLDSGITTRFWASDSDRVIDTARYFAAGFFGLDWKTDGSTELQVIPETADRGADTLTPGDTCKNFKEYTSTEQRYLKKLAEVQNMYLPPVAERLAQQNPGIEFSISEVYSMQEMCGFETTVRGSSPWCDVFTHEDWQHFEYARDVSLYYRLGPGNPYGGVMGWLWLNATTSLLLEGPDSGKTFFSFVHDGDMAPMMTALNLLQDENNDPHLPTTHIAKDRKWLTSQLMPMGGRIIFERLTCPPTSSPSEQFIRINVNDGIMPLGNCTSGPGQSCPLGQFAEFVRRRGVELGDFEEACGIEKSVDGGRLTFLHQRNL
ncbi:acid phosphatase pho5 [Arachnomyces sp. PD_36]|nr:acid phosphatase pho5 [Arachnomyces sp. PD_36]